MGHGTVVVDILRSWSTGLICWGIVDATISADGGVGDVGGVVEGRVEGVTGREGGIACGEQHGEQRGDHVKEPFIDAGHRDSGWWGVQSGINTLFSSLSRSPMVVFLWCRAIEFGMRRHLLFADGRLPLSCDNLPRAGLPQP